MTDEKKKPDYWEDDNFETRAEDYGTMILKHMTTARKDAFIREYYITKYCEKFKEYKKSKDTLKSDEFAEMDIDLWGERLLRGRRGI